MRGSEIRNSEQELHQFQLRVGIAGAMVLAAFALLAARFLWLQGLQHDVYQAKAEDNRISIVPVTPNRGVIVDRNGAVIARNYSGYTLEIFPRRVKNIERTIDAVSEFVDVTPRDRVRFRKLLQETRNAESLPIKNRLSDEEVAKFAANRYRFEGVEIKARLFRQYPLGDVGSHVLGYLGRINTQDQQKLEEYLTSVREIEQRIEKTEKFNDIPDPKVETPAGIPASFEDHVQLMSDHLVG